MIRELIMILAILVIATIPAQARSGSGLGSHGSHAHPGHRHRPPSAPSPYIPVFTHFPHGYPYLWEEGHWESQVYGGQFGNYTYLLALWVPVQWVCAIGDA